MRNSERLDKFYDKFKEIHKHAFPDWRFGQLINNFFIWMRGEKKRDFFFPEEQEMIDLFKEYANYHSPYHKPVERKDEIYIFDQLWESTALGFPGYGGSAMTWAKTCVIISGDDGIVFFNGEYAYTVKVNDIFMEDVKNHNMASVMKSGKYIKRE